MVVGPSRYPRPGTVLLGKYRVDRCIGEGGMGAVLQAHHIDLEEAVAIKVLLPEMLDRQEIVQRFLREAKAAVKLKGEHIARVIDVGRLDADVDGNFEGVPYIVMEHLEGSDLNAIIKAHGPQDPAISVDLVMQACEAIAEAHSLGIIHRDIKASNFFISWSGDDHPAQLKVLDFGIATTPKGTSELTDGGQIIGTPAYMAPEQMRSSRLADMRSDIWSMGVVLYELLEGARPFRAEAYSDLCLKVGMDPPEPMVQRAVPEGLRAVVMKCLEKSVERRYQSVAELSFDLMPFASDPVIARASVEQCARMLSRRPSRMIESHEVMPPPRLTAPMQAVREPSHTDSQLQALQAEPTLRRTPTSVNQSSGEMMEGAVPPHRGLVVVTSFLFSVAITGGGVLLYSNRGGDDAATAASQPAEPEVTAPRPAPVVVVPPPDEDKPVVKKPKPKVPAAKKPEAAKTVEPPPRTVEPPPTTTVAPAPAKTVEPPPTKTVAPAPAKTVEPPPAKTVTPPKKQPVVKKTPPPPPPPKPATDDPYSSRQ